MLITWSTHTHTLCLVVGPTLLLERQGDLDKRTIAIICVVAAGWSFAPSSQEQDPPFICADCSGVTMPGYDYKFLEKPKRRFQCPLCSKAMREPVQVSTCGHRFCDTCLQEFLR